MKDRVKEKYFFYFPKSHFFDVKQKNLWKKYLDISKFSSVNITTHNAGMPVSATEKLKKIADIHANDNSNDEKKTVVYVGRLKLIY